MLTRIDHVGIACRDLDATVAFYRKTFGFEVFHEEVDEDQGIREAMLRINGTDDGGASYLQLMEPTRPDCVVARFLERHGEGVHHIAFGSADVAGALAAAVAAGVRHRKAAGDAPALTLPVSHDPAYHDAESETCATINSFERLLTSPEMKTAGNRALGYRRLPADGTIDRVRIRITLAFSR